MLGFPRRRRRWCSAPLISSYQVHFLCAVLHRAQVAQSLVRPLTALAGRGALELLPTETYIA